MKNILGIILSSILLLQSTVFAYSSSTGSDTSFFSIPRLSESEIQKQCSYRFNRKICEQYYKYGKLRAQAWDAYDYSYGNAEHSEYYKLSAAELYEKYEQVIKDINYLWSINPEYKDMKLGEWITKAIIAWDIFAVALIAGAAVAPSLQAVGYTNSANTAQLFGSFSNKSFQFASVIKSVSGTGPAVRYMLFDTVLIKDTIFTLMYMSALGSLTEGAFAMFSSTAQDLNNFLQEHENIELAVKSRDLLQEMIDIELTEEEQKELERNKKQIFNSKEKIKELLKEALQDQDWQEDTTEQRVMHGEAVKTLYALEYVRAQMADMTDWHRYRESTIDIAQIYFSGDYTNLPDRKELFDIIDEAHEISLEQMRKKAEEDLIRHNGGLPLDDKPSKVGYYHIGHI